MQGFFLPKEFDSRNGTECSAELQRGATVTVPHWHSGFEIIFMHRGRADIFFFDKWHTLKEGELVIFPPGYVHCVRCDGEAAEKTVIGFSKKFTEACGCAEYPKRIEALMLNGSDARTVEGAVYGLLESRNKNTFLSNGYTLEIYGRIFELWKRGGYISDRECATESLAESIKKYAAAHLEERLSPYCVAEAFKISYSHMARLIEKEFNMSFIKMLNMLRIDKAKKLLILDGSNVTEVCFSVGFGDTSYFAKTFKSFTGISPSRYRSIAFGK